jgi:hypothetical protein
MQDLRYEQKDQKFSFAITDDILQVICILRKVTLQMLAKYPEKTATTEGHYPVLALSN